MLLHSDQAETMAAAPDEFEWVNAWVAQGVEKPVSDDVPRESNVVSLRIVSDTVESSLTAEDLPPAGDMQVEAVGPVKKPREHQVVLDILAIMRARDSLREPAPAKTPERGWNSILVRAHRTADSVPVILGSVMGLLMVIVFSTAAAFVKLAR